MSTTFDLQLKKKKKFTAGMTSLTPSAYFDIIGNLSTILQKEIEEHP